MNVEETVWKFLRGKGLPEKSCAAVMGNIEAESEFNEKLIEQGNGIGFGLCQWSYERRTKLERYGTDINHQLNFLWAELTGEISDTGASLEWIDKSGYLSRNKFITGDGSVEDLTAAMCFCWERPNAAVAHLERRQSSANKYLQQFTGVAGGDSANSQSEAITVEATNYEVVKGSEKEGDSLFGRRYRITVSDDQGNALDISNLHCLFDITKTIQMEPNLSVITVYNLNVKTENAIIASGKRVTVEAGYEGSQFGLIFDGDIIQCINSRDDGTTCKIEIIALDSDRAINFDIVNFSIVRGQTQRDIVEHMSNSVSNPIDLGSISQKLSGQKLSRGKVVFGKASDYYRQIAKSNDLQFYMDDGSINLISMDDLPEGEIFDLSSKSGLIGTPEQSTYGINGKCLLNPQIKLNSLIHVDNKLVRAKRIELSGSSVSPVGGVSTSVAGVRNKIIAEAKQICDDPNVQYSQEYRGQTVGGIKYWDCSSFAKHCYEVAGLSIVDITGPQYNQVKNEGGKFISQSEAQPGDLVFWGKGDACHHIAIYAGDGYVYAARGRDGKAPADQVAYHALYGEPEFGRPKCLIDADGGNIPTCNSTTDTGSDEYDSQGLFRALDKDGIYRVISMHYVGDTRGNDWYINFETIDQLGGAIASVSN
ncbi:phage protein [Clostridium sp.]|uniref:phage protein n=1 Tax=Clostridium sp. TaxID=1506 RepID=UPI0029013501|nr:phage tail tip lysozyme [Clostridium sp.]MDU1232313.1 phage tail tip lysozyme [Clostridium sp.]